MLSGGFAYIFSEYFAYAYLCAIFAGAIGGIAGVIILIKRESFFAASIMHAAYPGGVIALLIGVDMIYGISVSCIMFAIFMGLIRSRYASGRQGPPSAILAISTSLALLLIYLNPHISKQSEKILFGSILNSKEQDLIFIFAIFLICISAIYLLRHHFLYFAFDNRGYASQKLNLTAINYIYLFLVALISSALINAAGFILAISLVVFPAAIARCFCKNFYYLLFISPLVGALLAFLGLKMAFALSISPSGAICCVSFFALIFAIVVLNLQKLIFYIKIKPKRQN